MRKRKFVCLHSELLLSLNKGWTCTGPKLHTALFCRVGILPAKKKKKSCSVQLCNLIHYSPPGSFSSVQFSLSVVSNSLRPHELQHARPPCPSPTPGDYPNPCPLSRWCHPAISSSVVPFSCPQSFPALGSFPMSQLFAWGGQSTGVSASASVLPMNTQDWSPHRKHNSERDCI